jgi:hypothetical protein
MWVHKFIVLYSRFLKSTRYFPYEWILFTSWMKLHYQEIWLLPWAGVGYAGRCGYRCSADGQKHPGHWDQILNSEYILMSFSLYRLFISNSDCTDLTIWLIEE